jgi:nickel-type superoxide dismutase maturation protease
MKKINLTLIFLAALLAVTCFMFFNFSIVQVQGASMEPTYKNGDTVLSSRLPVWFGRVKVGDVVVLSDPTDGSIIIKRIQEIKNGQVWVIGDNYDKSFDSDMFGYVPYRLINSKVLD